jgi:hypothetical protein
MSKNIATGCIAPSASARSVVWSSGVVCAPILVNPGFGGCLRRETQDCVTSAIIVLHMDIIARAVFPKHD